METVRDGVIREDDKMPAWAADRQRRNRVLTVLPDAEPARYADCGCLVTEHAPHSQRCPRVGEVTRDLDAKVRATLQVSGMRGVASVGHESPGLRGGDAARQREAPPSYVGGFDLRATEQRIECFEDADLATLDRCAVLEEENRKLREDLRALFRVAAASRVTAAEDNSDQTGGGPDTSTAGVQRRVEGVIADLLAGRTTAAQRKGLGTATERAGRVTGDADKAIGRAIGAPRWDAGIRNPLDVGQ